ncbi:MAG: hypothetical protein ACO2PN_23935 [Pyrobaculum sp.]
MWMSAALRKNTPRISSAERGAVGVNAVGSVGVENLLVVYVVLASASTRRSY